MSLHRLLIGLYDYQACSVGLKMDVCMHRLQESRSQTTVNRSTEFEVTTSLRRTTVCTSVIVSYGVKMKDVLASQCNVRVVTFFSPKLTKTSSVRYRLLLSSKRSSLSLYRLRVVWALTEKTTGEYEFGSFSSWSCGSDWSPWKKPKRKDISLHDRSSAWRTRLFKWRTPYVGLRHFFWFFCRNSFDRDVGQFAAKWLAFLAMSILSPRLLDRRLTLSKEQVLSLISTATKWGSCYFLLCISKISTLTL